MKTPFCAFNVERQSFINLGVAIADTTLARLRGLIGKLRLRSDEALWVVPSRGIHTIGVLFSIDVMYLDSELHVIDAVEYLGPLRIAPIRWNATSVLLLPAGTVSASGTLIGDQLLICTPEELERHWARQHHEAQQEGKGSFELEAGSGSHIERLKKAI